jgi:hypothetical protein
MKNTEMFEEVKYDRWRFLAVAAMSVAAAGVFRDGSASA